MKIVITGPKCSGKTTIATALAERLCVPHADLDDLVLQRARGEGQEADSCATLFQTVGEKAFRVLERETLADLDRHGYMVLATGGSTLLDCRSRHLLRPASLWVYLKAGPDCLWDRIPKDPLPAYLRGESDPREAFLQRVACIDEVLSPRCDLQIDTEGEDREAILDEIVESLRCELAVQAHTPNTLGDMVRLTTFGESHGPMIGAVLDGVRPGLPLSEEDIQADLDRRRPGQSAVATARKESDTVEIVSGVFEGKTTGAPIAMLIRNADQRSSHYEAIRDLFRPGHADYTFWQKYGIRDYRGGGRSSGRETATRVAGGAVARKILADRGVTIRAWAQQVGDVQARTLDPAVIERNPVRCPDPEAAVRMEALIAEAKQAGDSVGGIVQVEAVGVPAGLGDPVFAKLDARLASALFSLGAVKGVEFGSGFACARLRGSAHNDPMVDGDFVSNNAGGILGGISSGQPIVARLAVKPTPSIAVEQATLDQHGANRTLSIEGRHDPCIVPRIVPVVEAMVALTLLNAWEVQTRLRPGWAQVGATEALPAAARP
ncbi:MAG: chorismate synthase [Planctomycetota bacterium]